MKKIMMFAALAVVPFLFSSCTSTSKEDVIYEIGVRVGSGSSMGRTDGEAYKLYQEIKNSISIPTETWKESVVDGDSSAADAKAIAKYSEAETKIKATEAELKAKVDALQDNSYLFSIEDVLYLRKTASGNVDKELKSYSVKFSNIK